MNERVLNTHSKGERVKIPLLPKQSKIKGARQRQWSRHIYRNLTYPRFFQNLFKNVTRIVKITPGATSLLLISKDLTKEHVYFFGQ